MTWAEFRIRSHAYNREYKNKLFLIREQAWITYIAPHLNPKKMKKSRDAFWGLEGESKSQSVTDAQREAIKMAQDQYKIDLENQSKKIQVNG